MQVFERREDEYYPDGSSKRHTKESRRSTLLTDAALIILMACVGLTAVQVLIAWKFQTQCPAGEVRQWRD